MQDVTGQKWGRLTAVRFAEWHEFPSGKRRQKWEFLCDCGKSVITFLEFAKSGHTRSCGCFQSQRRSESHTTHGGSKEYLYDVWCNLKQRCENPNYKWFNRWGGRGIKVLWKDYAEFRRDMLPSFIERHTIERIDNNGHYCKDNCMWATYREQARNRRSNRIIEFNGENRLLVEWSEKTGLKPMTIAHRLHSGWPVDRALTEPLRGILA